MNDPILTVTDLEKSYKGASGAVRAVDGISFEVNRGEVVGLLGPNGAGKTTTIKCLLGLVVPTEGEIRIAGTDPAAKPRSAYEHVSAVLEGARNVYWRLTVRENLRFFVGCQGIHPDALTDEYQRLVSLLGLEEKMDEQLRDLSRGMQQKASLACALVQDPKLLFLDEPTLGLDVEASYDLRRELRRLVEEEDRTIVLSSHEMNVVQELCDRVLILNSGRIVLNDTMDNLKTFFGGQAYRIVFAPGTMPETGLQDFDVDFLPGRELPMVQVFIRSSEEFYDLIDTLRAADAEIEHIESADVDLEEVFMNVIDETRRGSRVPLK